MRAIPNPRSPFAQAAGAHSSLRAADSTADRGARRSSSRAIQERDFSDPQRLTREDTFLYLPLLHGLMFETENVAWCEAALALLER